MMMMTEYDTYEELLLFNGVNNIKIISYHRIL